MDENCLWSENQNDFFQVFSKEFYRRFKKERDLLLQQAIHLTKTLHLVIMFGCLERFRGGSLSSCFQISPLKAQGPDGIHAIFYKRCWPIVGKYIFHMVQAFLHYGYLLKDLNRTYISLIPKKENLKKVCNYRLISLCNVQIYL